jgi:hypothetical protein
MYETGWLCEMTSASFPRVLWVQPKFCGRVFVGTQPTCVDVVDAQQRLEHPFQPERATQS